MWDSLSLQNISSLEIAFLLKQKLQTRRGSSSCLRCKTTCCMNFHKKHWLSWYYFIFLICLSTWRVILIKVNVVPLICTQRQPTVFRENNVVCDPYRLKSCDDQDQTTLFSMGKNGLKSAQTKPDYSFFLHWLTVRCNWLQCLMQSRRHSYSALHLFLHLFSLSSVQQTKQYKYNKLNSTIHMNGKSTVTEAHVVTWIFVHMLTLFSFFLKDVQWGA